MALVYRDRVKETSTTTGTGMYTLAGAVVGFQSFAAVGNGNTCYYVASDNVGWEVGVGTYTAAGTTLARTQILASSNSNNAVNWAAGTRNIWVDLPANVATYLVPGASLQMLRSNAAGTALEYAGAADVRNYLDTAVYVADRTALAAVDTTKDTVAWLKEAGREGAFQWDGSNRSALVTIDTRQGVYVPPSTDTTGASGAWVRANTVDLTPYMFGAVADTLQVIATVSITSGLTALTATGAAFVASDVGKRIIVPGAGVAGAALETTIAAFTDATHVTLMAAASTTLAAVSKTLVYGTDDYAALQGYANFCGYSGAPFALTDSPNSYGISQTVQVKVTRQLTPLVTPPESNIHFTDLLPFQVVGRGKVYVVALAGMTTMFELIYNATLSNLGPFYTVVDNIQFDGSSLTTNGIFSNYTMHVTTTNCRFVNVVHGIQYLGYGVGLIDRNVFICTGSAVYMPDGGGDASITRNDFYAGANNSVGVYMGHYAGDTRIVGNVFTNDDAYSGAVAVDIVAPPASVLPGESRHVTITDNEFAAYSVAIRTTGTSTSLRNVYQASVSQNHLIGIGGSHPGKFLVATDCTGFEVFSNFINHRDLGDAPDFAISLTRCERFIINNNSFDSYEDQAVVMVDVTDTVIEGNRFDNCGKSSASLAIIDISGSASRRNLVANNRFTQGSASYAQIGVKEGTGVDTTTGLLNVFDTVATPYSFVGSSSVGTFFNGVTMTMQGDATGFTFAPTVYIGTAAAGPNINLRRARGTAASPTAVLSGDRLGIIPFAGQIDTTQGNFGNGVALQALATENWSGTNRGSRLAFETTPNGSATRAERWGIEQNGALRATSGSLSRGAPVTKTADFTVADNENWLINNKSGSSCTVTLPAASSFPGREIMIKTIQAQTTVSASANVVPLAGGAAGTAILSANAGRWTILVSNGTNWETMAGVV